MKKLIYITGDTHAEFDRLSPSKLRFMKEGDTLIVCGDFGLIWDDSKREQKIIRQLGKRKYNICFIDGTHENFSLLNNYEEFNESFRYKIILFYPGEQEKNSFRLFSKLEDHHTYRAIVLMNE